MLKTGSLTKALFNHPTHSQPINFFTPSSIQTTTTAAATTKSGSVCETDPSSTSSSYKSNFTNNDIGNNDSLSADQQTESAIVLITVVDKLKRELTTIKQAKSQLETLYKASHIYVMY
jgi:hypothetical protein